MTCNSTPKSINGLEAETNGLENILFLNLILWNKILINRTTLPQSFLHVTAERTETNQMKTDCSFLHKLSHLKGLILIYHFKSGTYKERNWVANELRMLLHDFLDSPLFQVFGLILFKMQDDFCSTAQRFT